MKYTDPDGRFPVHIVIGVAVGAAIGAVSAACNGGSAREIAGAALGGALYGGLMAAVGPVGLGKEIAAGALAGVAAHNAEHLVTGEPTSVGSNLEAAVGGATAVMVGKCLEKGLQCVGDKISQTTSKLPQNVQNALNYIKNGQSVPQGKGGATWENRGGVNLRTGNPNQVLPKMDANGNSITYKEWDVNPKIPGMPRDAERIVTGSDGSIWYTNNHYESFTQLE